MKTNQNKKNSSKLASSNEGAGNDTKFSYEVELFWTQHSRATIVIKAKSLAEAEEMADELCSDEIEDWESCAGDMFVASVQLADGGSDDE